MVCGWDKVQELFLWGSSKYDHPRCNVNFVIRPLVHLPSQSFQYYQWTKETKTHCLKFKVGEISFLFYLFNLYPLITLIREKLHLSFSLIIITTKWLLVVNSQFLNFFKGLDVTSNLSEYLKTEMTNSGPFNPDRNGLIKTESSTQTGIEWQTIFLWNTRWFLFVTNLYRKEFSKSKCEHFYRLITVSILLQRHWIPLSYVSSIMFRNLGLTDWNGVWLTYWNLIYK